MIRLIGLVVFSFLFAFNASAQKEIKGANTAKAVFIGETKPLRDVLNTVSSDAEKKKLRKANRVNYTPPNFLGWDGPERVNPNAKPAGMDPVLQRVGRYNGLDVEPKFIVEGMDEVDAEGPGVPDANGSVGPNHYVQTVNATFIQVFDKRGHELSQPFPSEAIWNSVGATSIGDPVIQYDEIADRWLMTDLAQINQILYAVSTSPDPLGTYYAYTYTTPGWADYPKYGITPTSYFVTVNPGGGSEPFYIFNRDQMLAGAETIDVQSIDLPSLEGKFPTATPADWNGQTMPMDNDLITVRLKDDAWGNGNQNDVIELWKTSVDWSDANNTTATLVELFPNAYDADPCGDGGQACVPQKGSSQTLDVLSTVIMNKVTHRCFDTHESIVLNFTVNTGTTTGIRWMELRRTQDQDWSIYQEGTWAPSDDEHHWVGAISINDRGDIGLAYAVSGDNTYPSLRVTGRKSADPLGEMTMNELELKAGEGSRQSSDRYGDYFSMNVDPLSNNFWYTGEYVKADNSWGTIVTCFSLGRDTLDLTLEDDVSPQSSSDLSDMEEVRLKVKNIGLKSISGFTVGYQLDGMPAVIEAANIDTIHVDSIYEHVFMSSIDMSNKGSYPFTFFVNSSLDSTNFNDSLQLVIRNKFARNIEMIKPNIATSEVCATSAEIPLKFLNLTEEVVDSISFSILLNGGQPTFASWYGALSADEIATLNTVVENLQPGQNDIQVIVHQVNGLADQDVTNDTVNYVVNSILNPINATLSLTFDGGAYETSWELLNSKDETIASGDGYDIYDNQTITIDFCLQKDSCYTFVLGDLWGDGMMDGGNYTITDEFGNELASLINNEFGDQERNEFCVSGCNVVAAADIMDATGQTANDGVISVNVTSGLPPFEYSIDGGEMFQSAAIFENLPPNTYTVTVKDANGCLYEISNLVIDVNSSVVTLDDKIEMRLFPNPSKDGVYTLQLQGLSQTDVTIPYTIMNSAGKIIQHQQISQWNDGYEGRVSIHRFPDGVYYLQFRDQRISKMLKLVKG